MPEPTTTAVEIPDAAPADVKPARVPTMVERIAALEAGGVATGAPPAVDLSGIESGLSEQQTQITALASALEALQGATAAGTVDPAAIDAAVSAAVATLQGQVTALGAAIDSLKVAGQQALDTANQALSTIETKRSEDAQYLDTLNTHVKAHAAAIASIQAQIGTPAG